MHPAITQVWKQNFEAEISRLDRAFFNYRVISVDAKSPGFIRDTPREVLSEAERYRDLKFNVDILNVCHVDIYIPT